MNCVFAATIVLASFAADPIAPLPEELVGQWTDDAFLDPNAQGYAIFLDATGPSVILGVPSAEMRPVVAEFNAKTNCLTLRTLKAKPKTRPIDPSIVGDVKARYFYDSKSKALVPADEDGKALTAVPGEKPIQELRRRSKEFSEKNKKVFFGE